MKLKCLLLISSSLLLHYVNCAEQSPREGRVLNRKSGDFEAQPSIEQQIIQEYSAPNATDANFDDIIDEIIIQGRNGRNVDGLDDVYSDPTVKEALLNGDDVQARNLIREKLCDLGLMQCDEPKRPHYPGGKIIYTNPPPGAPLIYSRPPPGYRPQGPAPIQGMPSKGYYGPPRPVPVPSNNIPQQPPRKIGYASPPGLNSYVTSRPLGPTYDKYSTDFYEVDSIPTGVKFGYTEKPTIVVNQGKREVGVQQNHHVHHHYVHVDGSQGTGLIDGTKTVLVNTPISEYSAVNSLSSSYQTNGFSGSDASSIHSGGFSPVAPDYDYKGVNSGSSQGIYSQVKPVFETSNTYASGTNYNQQSPAVFTDGNNGIFNAASQSFHSSAPDFYKKELNINGPNRGNNFAQQQQQQQSYLNSGSNSGNNFNTQQYSNKNQYEGYQGLESARQDQYDCVCVPYEQCPAQDVVGRRDDLILPLDPRNLGSEIEADLDTNSTSTVSSNSTIVESKKISKREAPRNDDDVEKVQGEGVSRKDRILRNINSLSLHIWHFTDTTETDKLATFYGRSFLSLLFFLVYPNKQPNKHKQLKQLKQYNSILTGEI